MSVPLSVALAQALAAGGARASVDICTPALASDDHDDGAPTVYALFDAALSGFLTVAVVVVGIAANVYSLRVLAQLRTGKVRRLVGRPVDGRRAPSPCCRRCAFICIRWPPGTRRCSSARCSSIRSTACSPL